MTQEPTRPATLLALERHLEIYGADERRWPEAARERFASLIASDARARASLAEARALDRLLDRASWPSVSRERAVRDRIMAAVSNDSGGVRSAPAAARVVELPPRRQPPRTAPVASRTGWRIAALLAASLAIGIYLGSAGGLTPEVQAVAEVVGLEAEADSYQLSLLDDNAPLSEEDLL
jgi:uncharacterized membrane protein YccC